MFKKGVFDKEQDRLYPIEVQDDVQVLKQHQFLFDDWTETEILKLVEQLRISGMKVKSLHEHVKTKTKKQVIAKLTQMREVLSLEGEECDAFELLLILK